MVRSVTLSSDGNHAYVAASMTMRSVGLREMRHRRVNLRRNIKGRSEWSGRFGWCEA